MWEFVFIVAISFYKFTKKNKIMIHKNEMTLFPFTSTILSISSYVEMLICLFFIYFLLIFFCFFLLFQLFVE